MAELEDYSHLSGKWVRLCYQVASTTQPRDVSGRLELPEAGDDDDLVFKLKLTSSCSAIPIYKGMIISCDEDPDRAWLTRSYASGNESIWWA